MMNRKNRIESIFKKNLSSFKFEIIDNSIEHSGHNGFNGSQESHFKLILKKDSDKIIDKITIHRKINELLADEFCNGMHALEIKIIS